MTRLHSCTAMAARTGPDWSCAGVLEGAFDHLDTRYGGVEGYLNAGGIPPEQFSTLRDRLV